MFPRSFLLSKIFYNHALSNHNGLKRKRGRGNRAFPAHAKLTRLPPEEGPLPRQSAKVQEVQKDRGTSKDPDHHPIFIFPCMLMIIPKTADISTW